jgi:hypothetical protein
VAAGSSSTAARKAACGGNFLGTMGQGLNTVAAFLNGRNLQGKIEDIDDALDTMKATRVPDRRPAEWCDRR